MFIGLRELPIGNEMKSETRKKWAGQINVGLLRGQIW